MDLDSSDVFLAHNSKDKDFVLLLRDNLLKRNIGAWVDEQEIRPDKLINPQIEEAIDSSKCICLCFGLEGLGKYQEFEADQAFNRTVHEQKSIAIILLPGADEDLIPARFRGFRPIIFEDDASNVHALNLIEWIVTGVRPDDAPDDRAPPDPIVQPNTATISVPEEPTVLAKAIGEQAAALRKEGVNVLVGPHMDTTNQYPGGTHHTPFSITKALLSDLDFPTGNFDTEKLAPSVDHVGVFYALRKSHNDLEKRVKDAVDLSTKAMSTAHKRLASICSIDREKNRTEKYAQRRANLLITTNFDLQLERALLVEGVSFYRVVMDVSQGKLHVSDYAQASVSNGHVSVHSPSNEILIAQIDDPDELDDLISAPKLRVKVVSEPKDALLVNGSIDPFSDPEKPVLFKYHGSFGFPLSCAISTDQYFRLTRIRENVPQQIRESLSNRSSLFLGYRFMEPEFQQLYETLLKDAFGDWVSERYGVQLKPESQNDPYSKMEEAVWIDLSAQLARKGISRLEVSEIAYLDLLLSA